MSFQTQTFATPFYSVSSFPFLSFPLGTVAIVTGHHLSHGCNEDNIRNDNHTEFKREFASLLTYGGFTVIIEEQRCFASTTKKA
jgi:hypothetical protein